MSEQQQQPQSLSLPTPEQFDAAYDGSVDFLVAFRQTSLYPIVRKFATRTPGEPMQRIEVTDAMVDEYIVALDKCDDKAGRPRPRREFPLIKKFLQNLVAALQDELADQGGVAGIITTLIKGWLTGLIV